tara:strand:+ start:754 stop:1449 length:696 start_codon:yes stop_codon:yes gene_type:complete
MIAYTEHRSVYQVVRCRFGVKPVEEVGLSEDSKQMLEQGAVPGRRIRADAQRNEDAVLEAAKQVFAASGVDAPVREIAARAGVGVGTLYRRFPSRSDLVAAVFRREVDACAAEAVVLAANHAPGEALSRWLKRYTGFIATKKGLAAALHSGDQAFETLPAYFRASFEPALGNLLEAAAAAGEIRGGIDAYDLLRAVGNLSVSSTEEGLAHTSRMLDLMIDGMRFGASGSKD